MNSKKGLSDVVTTVLIILLVLAAIVIIWSFIRPTLVNTGTTVEAQSKCVSVDVQPVACTISSSGTTLGVVKYVSGSPAKTIIILQKADGTRLTDPQNTPSAGGTVSKDFAGAATGGKLYAAATVIGSDGKDYSCPESAVIVDCKVAA